MMETLRQYLWDLLTGDPTLQQLCGISADDPRVYWYFQGDAEITATKPAYITYALVTRAEQVSAVSSPIFSMMVWSRYLTTIEDITARLMVLLDRVTLTLPSGAPVYSKIVSESDSFQTEPNYAGRNLQVRFSFLNLPEEPSRWDYLPS